MRTALVIALVALGTTCMAAASARADDTGASVGVGVGSGGVGVGAGVGVNGTGVVTVLAHGDHPDWYGLPANPRVPLLVKFWKSVLRPLGVVAIFGVVLGAFAHHTKYGIKQAEGSDADTNLPPR